MSLIRRPVHITPVSLEYYKARLGEGGWVSFWGHENTLEAAKNVCGHDLRPPEARPAMTLDPAGYPVLYGRKYRECLLLSPEYSPGYRPVIGKEDSPDDIQSWHALRMEWE
ncbi:MAG: hypothetical protein J6Y92_09840 [Lentisphaeria bacterium]|nr:hypothetical protein [Lentisphaeria bacterium]